ncbi:MAG: 2-hydroxychromene-2-carboxylate isomerase [Candidatus Binatia bacterium]
MAQPEKLEYYFSLLSLYTYIGSRALRELVQRRALEVVYKPIDLMAVFAATGGVPVKQRSIPRQSYRLVEMQRWRDLRNIPLVLQPRYYPVNPSRAHRLLLAALRQGRDVGDFVHAGLSAVWADERNLEDADTLVRLADAAGLDGAALLAQTEDPALQEREAALTREAIERKVFGAPFFFWRGEPFWGQDRLEMLEAVIASGRAPIEYRDP